MYHTSITSVISYGRIVAENTPKPSFQFSHPHIASQTHTIRKTPLARAKLKYLVQVNVLLLRKKMPWVRPASVPVGQVWSRFKGPERNGEPGKNYQIRDMDEKWRNTCLGLMQETFLRDEPISIALGINTDPESIATLRANWEGYVSQNMSLACFTEVDGEPDELVGFNVTYVKTRDDEEEDFDKIKGDCWKKILQTLTAAEELVDVFEYYRVDKFLTSCGLTVLPKFRGQNIGARIFEARRPLCASMGIKATATVFTAVTSQVLAAKCGYEVLAELNYADMIKYGVDLSSSTTPTAKFMGTKF